MNKNKFLSITAIIPSFNAGTTIYKCLESLKKQKYPIEEAIVIDGGSSDDTIEKVMHFIRENKTFKLNLIRPTKNTSVGASYNLGAKLARTELVVALHSDSILPTINELSRLVKPILDNDTVVATYPIVINPKNVWDTYSFWLKCHFARWAGSETPSMNGKFDCYRRDIFLKIGGHDTSKFQDRIGAEDVNLSQRLRKTGRVTLSKAKILHMHYMGDGYTLKKWIEYRKVLSLTYGKVIKNHWLDLKHETIIFLIKPGLVVLSLISATRYYAIFIMIALMVYYLKNVYLDSKARHDPRIFLLPFVSLFLMYYETYWIVRGILFTRRQV